MKTCTCPHEATRNGLLRTGYNSLCPFHGVPLARDTPVSTPYPVAAAPVVKITEAALRCVMCEGLHPDYQRCDFVDEN